MYLAQMEMHERNYNESLAILKQVKEEMGVIRSEETAALTVQVLRDHGHLFMDWKHYEPARNMAKEALIQAERISSPKIRSVCVYS